MMTIQVRTITAEESEVLNQWQRADNVVGYRRARTLRLSAAGWQCAAIAEELGIHNETVRMTVKDFNEGGLPAIPPSPVRGAAEQVRQYCGSGRRSQGTDP